jgi:uncharacterized protein YfkK (UPF0435 family)
VDKLLPLLKGPHCFSGIHDTIMVHKLLKEMNKLDLSQKTVENIEFMVNEISQKLKVLNVGVLKSSHFSEEAYEELRDIYMLVKNKTNFSISEMQAIAEELGNIKK